MDSDALELRVATEAGADNQVLTPTILEYYKKFGRKRDLEQYFSLSTAQGEVRDPSSLFWRRMKSQESSDSGEKSKESSMEVCRISIKCTAPESTASSLDDNLAGDAKSDSVSPPIITEEPPLDTSRPSNDDDEKSDDESQKSMDAVLDTSTNKALSPSSSITSQRRLEWDSLADVGYANESDKKTSASSLSTLERLALLQQYSNNDTTHANPMGPPTAHSTPVEENETKTKTKKGSKTTKIYRKDVDLVEFNVPHCSDANPSQSINVNLTKHISFNVEKDGGVSVEKVQKNVLVTSPEKQSIDNEMTPQMKMDKEIQTSLAKDDKSITETPKALYGQSVPVLINLNALKKRQRKRKVKSVRKRSRSNIKSDANKENFPAQEKSVEQVSEAESFEYMPGHIYNQKQIDKESSGNVVGNKSSLESSGAATTDSSKGMKETFTQDLDKGIKLLKETFRKRYDNTELKRRLVKEVVQRLIKANYSDEESSTDFLSGLTFDSKKLDMRETNTTTSTSDNTAEKSKLSRPKKSILRCDKFSSDAIASTSQSVPNLPSVSKSEKPVTSKLKKQDTESDASSKEKTSSETVFAKTSSEELYQKYLDALRREEIYKRHLRDKENFMKQKLVASDDIGFNAQSRLDVKSRIRIKELMNDLTRNNYDDGSGDASKLEGSLRSNLDLRPSLRTHRSQSVFTLSSGNVDQNKKGNFKKSDSQRKATADNIKAGSHYCLCSHPSGQRLGISDSSCQANVNQAEPSNTSKTGKTSPRTLTKIIPDDNTGEIKYICLCDRKIVEKDVPDSFLIYKCSRLPNKGVQYGASCSGDEYSTPEASKQRSTTDNNANKVSKCSQTNLKVSESGRVKEVICVHEAIRCVQTDITINPRISDPSIADMNIIDSNDCVILVGEQYRQVSKSTIAESGQRGSCVALDDGTTSSSARSRQGIQRLMSARTIDAQVQSDVDITKDDNTEATNVMIRVNVANKPKHDHAMLTDAIAVVEDATSTSRECGKGVQCQTDNIFAELARKTGNVNTPFPKDFYSLKNQSSVNIQSHFPKAYTYPTCMGSSYTQTDESVGNVHPRVGILKPSIDIHYQTEDSCNPFSARFNQRNLNVCGPNITEKACVCMSANCEGECMDNPYLRSDPRAYKTPYFVIRQPYLSTIESISSGSQASKNLPCGCSSALCNGECNQNLKSLSGGYFLTKETQASCGPTLPKKSCGCQSADCLGDCETNPQCRRSDKPQGRVYFTPSFSKPTCSRSLPKQTSCGCSKVSCQGDCETNQECFKNITKPARSQSLPQNSQYFPNLAVRFVDSGTQQYGDMNRQHTCNQPENAVACGITDELKLRQDSSKSLKLVCSCGCGSAECHGDCQENKPCRNETEQYETFYEKAMRTANERKSYVDATKAGKLPCACGCGSVDCHGDCQENNNCREEYSIADQRRSHLDSTKAQKPSCVCGCGSTDCHGDCDERKGCRNKMDEPSYEKTNRNVNSRKSSAESCACGCGSANCHGDCDEGRCRHNTERTPYETSSGMGNERKSCVDGKKTPKPSCSCGCGSDDCHGECGKNEHCRNKTETTQPTYKTANLIAKEKKSHEDPTRLQKPPCACGCGSDECHGECDKNERCRNKTDKMHTNAKRAERPSCTCGCERADCNGDCGGDPDCHKGISKTTRSQSLPQDIRKFGLRLVDSGAQHTENVQSKSSGCQTLSSCGCSNISCQGDCEKNPECGGNVDNKIGRSKSYPQNYTVASLQQQTKPQTSYDPSSLSLKKGMPGELEKSNETSSKSKSNYRMKCKIVEDPYSKQDNVEPRLRSVYSQSKAEIPEESEFDEEHQPCGCGKPSCKGDCAKNPQCKNDSDIEEYDDRKTNSSKLSTDPDTRPSRDLIMNVIQDITRRYSKKNIEGNERKKCYKEILSLLNYLLDTEDTESDHLKGVKHGVAESSSSDFNRMKKTRQRHSDSKTKEKTGCVDSEISSPEVSHPCASNIKVKGMKSDASTCPKQKEENNSKKKCDKGIQLSPKPKSRCCTESSELPISSELPCTSSDSATCKVLNKIRKECEKYHQKRCKASNKCDCTSTTSVSCDRCKRIHHCMCRTHKCKGYRPRNVCERIRKKCVAYNLIIQTSESMVSEEPSFEKGCRPLKNIIVKVPPKRPQHVDAVPFKEEPYCFSPRSEGRGRSRSVPNETYFSSTDEGKAKMITIRNYLEKNRPDFVEQCNRRQKCLKVLGEARCRNTCLSCPPQLKTVVIQSRETSTGCSQPCSMFCGGVPMTCNPCATPNNFGPTLTTIANERSARELLCMQMQVEGAPALLSALSDSDLRGIARELGIHLRQKRAAPKFISEREMKKHSEKIYKSLPEVMKKKEEKRKENIKKTNLLMANIFKKNLQRKVLRGAVNLSNYSAVIKI